MSAQGRPEIDHHEGEWDEVAEVLAVLRRMAQEVASPAVRACLESACEDIAHLTGTGAEAA
jgi:hypothetical protein